MSDDKERPSFDGQEMKGKTREKEHKIESDTMLYAPILGHYTYREHHALVNGLYAGVVEGSRKHDYEKERHYWRFGYLIGSGIRYSALLLLLSVQNKVI